MFVQDDYCHVSESERMAAQRLMRELDKRAAENGREVSGDVTIAASEVSPFGYRVMRLEADTVSR